MIREWPDCFPWNGTFLVNRDFISSRELWFFKTFSLKWETSIHFVVNNDFDCVFHYFRFIFFLLISVIAKYSEAKQMFLETHCPFAPDFLRYGQWQRKCIDWLNSQSFKRLLQQKAMITMENDIVAGDILLWLRGNSYDSSQFVLLFFFS